LLRKLSLTALLASVVILLTGCVKLNIDLNVNSDDTVSGTMIVAFQDMGTINMQPTQFYTPQEGMTVEPYKDDTYVGSKITFAKKTFKDFSLGSDSSGLSFSRDGNFIRVHGLIALAGSSNADDIKSNPFAGLLTGGDIRVSITMPGKITSAKGKVEGNKVTFTGKLGEDLVIDASSDTSPDNSWIAFAIGCGTLLGLGIWILARRANMKKNQNAETVSELEVDQAE
jgi:hypothetical protein